MRKGFKRIDWTTADIEFLRENAGILTKREICFELKKSKKSVERKAESLGISLRVHNRKLQWCALCASWRATVSPRTGICTVCRKREQLRNHKVTAADCYGRLTPAQKLDYEKNEAKRGTRKMPKRPRKTSSDPMSRYQRAKAQEQYLRDVERWEIACLKLQIDAAKQDVKRMREKLGENPRKKSK